MNKILKKKIKRIKKSLKKKKRTTFSLTFTKEIGVFCSREWKRLWKFIAVAGVSFHVSQDLKHPKVDE